MRLSGRVHNRDLLQIIATGLLNFRQQMGWTRLELAAMLPDVSVPKIQKWESASGFPRGIDLIRISRLLEIDLTSYPPGAFDLGSVNRALRLSRNNATERKLIIDVPGMLSTLRFQQGLSVKEFAAQIGVPTVTYKNWENGHIPIGKNAHLVADKLNLPLSAIGLI